MSNRMTFWAIWLMALIPIVGAFIMYFGDVGIPEGRTHHGELVVRGTQASDLGFPDMLVEKPVWQVILVSSSDCSSCELFDSGLDSFHTAVGRERDRVAVLQVDLATTTTLESAIWIIDPLGNVVLKFEPSINPTLILRDLKKLLKLSKVG